MRYSFSMVDLFRQCPFKWFLRYGKKVKIEDDFKPDHPFKIGHLLHDSIELGLDTAIDNYYSKFPIIDNPHVEEVIKISKLYPEYINMIPSGENEYKLLTDDFIGYIDLLVKNSYGTYDIWDFKYSNNIDHYKNSMQLHVYKYYFEKITGKKVKNLRYLFVPKVSLKKDFETPTAEFRKQLNEELEKVHPEIVDIPYNLDQVKEYFEIINQIEDTSTKLKKKVGGQCWWCEYEDICIKSTIKEW